MPEPVSASKLKAKKLITNTRKLGELVVELLKISKRLKSLQIDTAFICSAQQRRDKAVLARRIAVTQQRYAKLMSDTAKLV